MRERDEKGQSENLRRPDHMRNVGADGNIFIMHIKEAV